MLKLLIWFLKRNPKLSRKLLNHLLRLPIECKWDNTLLTNDEYYIQLLNAYNEGKNFNNSNNSFYEYIKSFK